MRHVCLYIGVQIFIAGGRAGVRVYGCTGVRVVQEVVQEALADLKNNDTLEE